MRSIQSSIDEGFEIVVYKESDVKPELSKHSPNGPVLKLGNKSVEITLDESDTAICICDFCSDGAPLEVKATLAFCGSDNQRRLAFVHDRCYVSALAQWGLKEES